MRLQLLALLVVCDLKPSRHAIKSLLNLAILNWNLTLEYSFDKWGDMLSFSGYLHSLLLLLFLATCISLWHGVALVRLYNPHLCPPPKKRGAPIHTCPWWSLWHSPPWLGFVQGSECKWHKNILYEQTLSLVYNKFLYFVGRNSKIFSAYSLYASGTHKIHTSLITTGGCLLIWTCSHQQVYAWNIVRSCLI